MTDPEAVCKKVGVTRVGEKPMMVVKPREPGETTTEVFLVDDLGFANVKTLAWIPPEGVGHGRRC